VCVCVCVCVCVREREREGGRERERQRQRQRQRDRRSVKADHKQEKEERVVPAFTGMAVRCTVWTDEKN